MTITILVLFVLWAVCIVVTGRLFKASGRSAFMGHLVGFFPLVICLGLWIAEAGVHDHAASLLYLIVALVIMVVQIRNKVVKSRIKRKYGFK